MKHFSLPNDVDFPELDATMKAELDAMHAENLQACPASPQNIPGVTSFSSDFLRKLPAINRAMYKYVWLRHVREYEEFMRVHPELDKD